MRKGLIILACVFYLQACNNGGQGGVVDDGIRDGGDSNGALNNNLPARDSSIDTSVGDDRVDTERRDSTRVRDSIEALRRQRR